MTAIRFEPSRTQILDIDHLEAGMEGLTPTVGAYLAEAAITCLEQGSHASDVHMDVDGDCDCRLALRWT